MPKLILPLVILTTLTGAGLAQKKFTTQYDEYFRKYSKHYFGVNFDWRWFKAQAIAESGLNEKAESWVKAKGLMQLMPDTFADMKSRMPHLEDIFEPRWNIAAGIYYDRLLWKMWETVEAFTDRMSFTFGSYNAGHRTLQKAQVVAKEKGHDEKAWNSIVTVAPEVPRWRHEETLGYVERIHGLVEEVER